MLLASMQQAAATRAEPLFVAPAQRLRSFLLKNVSYSSNYQMIQN